MFSIPCKQQCLCVQLQLALSSEQLVSTELRPEGLLQGGRTVVETPHPFPASWGVSLWNEQTGSWMLNITPCVFPNPSFLPCLCCDSLQLARGSELFHQVWIVPDPLTLGIPSAYTFHSELVPSASASEQGRVSLLPSHVPSSSWCQEPTCLAKGLLGSHWVPWVTLISNKLRLTKSLCAIICGA